MCSQSHRRNAHRDGGEIKWGRGDLVESDVFCYVDDQWILLTWQLICCWGWLRNKRILDQRWNFSELKLGELWFSFIWVWFLQIPRKKEQRKNPIVPIGTFGEMQPSDSVNPSLHFLCTGSGRRIQGDLLPPIFTAALAITITTELMAGKVPCLAHDKWIWGSKVEKEEWKLSSDFYQIWVGGDTSNSVLQNKPQEFISILARANGTLTLNSDWELIFFLMAL